jgi:hypothetical protein
MLWQMNGMVQPSSVTLNWTSTYGSFIFHHGELRFFHPIFLSSNWTQHIRSLVNFIIYLEPPYLLDYNYIVVPLPTGFFVSAYLNGEGVQEFLTWSLKIGTFVVPKLWTFISFSNQVCFDSARTISYSPWKYLSNGVYKDFQSDFILPLILRDLWLGVKLGNWLPPLLLFITYAN